MAAAQLVESVRLFEKEIAKISQQRAEAMEAANLAKVVQDQAVSAESIAAQAQVGTKWKDDESALAAHRTARQMENDAANKLRIATSQFNILRAAGIGMGEFAKQLDCSKIMTTSDMDAKHKESLRQVEHSLNRIGKQKEGEKDIITKLRQSLNELKQQQGGVDENFELAPDLMTSKETLRNFYNGFDALGNGDGDDSIVDFAEFFKRKQQSSDSDKTQYKSEWIVDASNGTSKSIDKEQFAKDSLAGKEIFKCLKMGTLAELETCLQTNVDDDYNDIITKMSSKELELLFKKFEVPFTTLTSGIQVPSKQWFKTKGARFPDKVKEFVAECINMCNQPINYFLLNDNDAIDCYKAEQKKLQEAKCNTMRSKGNMPTAPSSLCASMSPYNVGMPLMIAGLSGGGVKFVNNSNSMGRFLLSGGASFKQTGGDCCADRYKKLLDSIKSTLASRGVKINGQDLRKLDRTIAVLTAGEEELIKLQQKVQHFANQRSLLNCGVPKNVEIVTATDIFEKPENLDKVFEKNLEECQKDMTNLLQSQNQVFNSQFVPGINALIHTLQPLQYLSSP